MRAVEIWVIVFVCVGLIITGGCNEELKNCKVQNDIQRKRIAELESEVKTSELRLAQLMEQLKTAKSSSDVEADALKQAIAVLEKDLADKRTLIASMQEQLLLGGVKLPVELSTMLEDFAKDKDMVTYDAERGIVKFKSDLLFKSGSDEVTASAADAVRSLCKILNTEQGREFDIIIAGHTDDQPIRHSRGKHPSNWHLSAHRAIAVLRVMAGSDIVSERLSARGFGEFRPIVPNKPNKMGNKQNRRVEIFIVPRGT